MKIPKSKRLIPKGFELGPPERPGELARRLSGDKPKVWGSNPICYPFFFFFFFCFFPFWFVLF